tara:strand:+ start:56 stop:211 length:156 start_codon:yes stop_codon:yes gene_type:complete
LEEERAKIEAIRIIPEISARITELIVDALNFVLVGIFISLAPMAIHGFYLE